MTFEKINFNKPFFYYNKFVGGGVSLVPSPERIIIFFGWGSYNLCLQFVLMFDESMRPFWQPLNAKCGDRVEWPYPRNKHMHYLYPENVGGVYYVKSEVSWVCILFLVRVIFTYPKPCPLESPLDTDKILICHASWIHVTHHRLMHPSIENPWWPSYGWTTIALPRFYQGNVYCKPSLTSPLSHYER